MHITKQTNHNECGICVLTSLTKFFHKNNIDKISVLNQANVKEQGLSLFDFEILAQKLGINTDTYEMEWSEFITYKTNDFLVVPIQINTGLHYVIVKKHKKTLTVYDSRYDEPIEQTYHEFNKYFSKIVIVVQKFRTSFKFPLTSRIDIFKNIRLSYLIISILIQIGIVILSTFAANYLNSIINSSISNSSFKNGLIITFVFLLVFILNGLVKYILKLFCARGFKECFRYLSNNFVISINQKRNDFLNKVNANNFYLVDTAIQSISNFLTYEISAFCSNVFLTIVTMTIIACINPYFLLISLVSIASVIIIGFIQYNFKRKILSLAITNQNINNNICREYIDYFSTQKNILLREKLSSNLKNNYNQFVKLYIKKTKFDGTSSFVSEIIYGVIYFLIILIASFLIINNKNMNIGQLTFLIAIIGMLHASTESICDFVIKKVEFGVMKEIYENLVMVGNLENESKLKVDKIHSLFSREKDEIVEIENGRIINKDIYDLICGECNSNKSLLINNIDYQNINQIDWAQKQFHLNIYSVIKPEWLIDELHNQNDVVIEGLKIFQINLKKINYSLQEQTLLNLLFLSYVKDKLVVLDDNLRYLTKQQTQWVNKTLLPYIKQSNFVLLTQSK